MNAKLQEAISLFNRRDYFDCHEILENVWHEAPPEDKSFYEGLIRLATGLHLRFQRRALQGGINLLTQALIQLEQYRPVHQGINVARLYEDIDAHVEDLKAAKKSQPGFFERWRAPRIYMVE